MKKRKLLSLLLVLGLLTGCGGTPTEADKPSEPTEAADSAPENMGPSTQLSQPPQPEQILSDLCESKEIELPNGILFSDCEVIKRQSNPEQKEDIVYCAVTAENHFYRAQRQYKLLYNFYDEGGWILDEATPENEDEWTDAYLDAAGNDILEDMVWLDAFSPAQLECIKYLNEFNGTHYLAIDDFYVDSDPWKSGSSGGGFTIFDHTGKELGHVSTDSAPFSLFRVNEAFPASDGSLRIILNSQGQDDNGEFQYVDYLTDHNGARLSEYYHTLFYVEKYGIIVASNETSGTSLYGALDENGNVVVPLQYKDTLEVYRAVDPDYTYTPSTSQENDLPYPVLNGIAPRGVYFLDGVYTFTRKVLRNGETFRGNVLVNVKGAPLFSMEYGMAEAIQSMNNQGLIMVTDAMESEGHSTYGNRDNPYSIRIYDPDGNCRTPELTIGNLDFSNNESYIVMYQGRYGILPPLLTDEEHRYFSHQWGIDHQNDGEPLSGELLAQIVDPWPY